MEELGFWSRREPLEPAARGGRAGIGSIALLNPELQKVVGLTRIVGPSSTLDLVLLYIYVYIYILIWCLCPRCQEERSARLSLRVASATVGEIKDFRRS